MEQEKDKAEFWRYRRGEAYKDFLLDSFFTSRNLLTSVPETHRLTLNSVFNYSHDIKRAVRIFYEVLNPHDTDLPDSEKVLLEKARRIAPYHMVMLIVAIYDVTKEPTGRTVALQILERIAFFERLPTTRDLDPEFFVNLAINLKTGKQKLAELTTTLQNAQQTLLTKIDYASILSEWVKRQGFYGWGAVKYFLFEYEQELKRLSKTNRDKLIWEEFAREDYETDYATVEHIYPQKPTDECWRKQFASYTVKERNILRNSIGNLLPLSKPKNSSLRNKCFTDKKGDQSQQVGYLYGCYSEIEVAQCAEWGAVEIVLRGIRLLGFLEKRWGLGLGDKREKVKLLGLDFVLKKEPQLASALK